MKNYFAEDYIQEAAILRRYDQAIGQKSSIGRAKAQADFRAFENGIRDKGPAYAHLYYLYSSAMERGNSSIDLEYVEKTSDIPALIDSLRKFGAEKFTLSSGQTDAAWAFIQNGCALNGMVEINSSRFDIDSGECEKLHAYLFIAN